MDYLADESKNFAGEPDHVFNSVKEVSQWLSTEPDRANIDAKTSLLDWVSTGKKCDGWTLWVHMPRDHGAEEEIGTDLMCFRAGGRYAWTRGVDGPSIPPNDPAVVFIEATVREDGAILTPDGSVATVPAGTKSTHRPWAA